MTASWWRIWIILAAVLGPLVVGGIVLVSTQGSGKGVFLVPLSVFIYVGPALWGLRNASVARRRLEAEEALVESVVERTGELLSELERDPGSLKVNMKDAPRQVLGSWTESDDAEPTVVRMVQHLCREAEGLRFPPIPITTQFYMQDLDARLPSLRSPQTIALRLGILFTFMGLLISFIGVEDSLSPGQASDGDIGKLVGGLTAAFGTSVAGLLASVLLQPFVEILQDRVGKFAQKLEDAVGGLIAALSKAQTGVAFAKRIDVLDRRLHEHQEQLRDHMHGVEQTIGQSIRQFDGAFEAARESAEGLRGSSNILEGLEKDHRQQVERLMDSMQKMGDLESSLARVIQDQTRQVIDAQKEQIDQAMGVVRDSLTTVAGEVSVSVSKLGADASDVAQQSHDVAASIALHSDQTRDILAGLRQSQEKSTQVVSRLADVIPALSSTTTVAADMGALAKPVERLNQRMDALVQSAQRSDRRERMTLLVCGIVVVFSGVLFATLPLWLEHYNAFFGARD